MKHIPASRTPVLIVDDDITHLLSVKALLRDSDIPEPALVSDSRLAMDLIREHGFIFVLLDLLMPHLDGLSLLRQIKQEFSDVECVVLTANDDTASAVKAIKYGAYDYMVKPFHRDKLIILIHRALERYTLRKGMALSDRTGTFAELKHPEAFDGMVMHDSAMARVCLQAELVAQTDYSVIITGESGTGKEMLARAIHRASPRAGAPFVAVNMGAISSSLFENEFFGHSKGAFTGASEKKEGFLEAARGGTLFLDEITDLDISRQGVLLRVLQEKEFFRIGSTRMHSVDVRVLATTNRDFQQEIENGRFRADLFHRLNMYRITLPRLADRKADIPALARHFLKEFARRSNRHIVGLAPELEQRLLNYDFPGNIRELKNLIAAAVLLEQGEELTSAALPENSPVLEQKTHPQTEATSLAEIECAAEFPPLEEIEKRYICKVLESVNQNRTRAAAILGISLRTLQRKLNSFAATSK